MDFRVKSQEIEKWAFHNHLASQAPTPLIGLPGTVL